KCTAMENYNGDLYFGTDNNFTGFELWKTSDGVSFVNVADTLGTPLTTVARMKSSGGKLWILAKNNGGDFSVYSYDGTTLVEENNTEFGAQYINVDNYSAMESFNGHLYVGVTQFHMPSL